MANNHTSGTIYVDSTGTLVSSKVKVAYIMFNASAAGDSVTLRDGTSATDPIKFIISGDTTRKTFLLDFSNKPVVFQNGIHCSAINAGSYATLVLTSSGE